MRRRTLFALCAIPLVGVAAGVQKLRRYTAQDPRFCISCHEPSPEFALWIESPHRKVACQGCHHSRPEQGLAMIRAFLLGQRPGHSGEKHAPVRIGSCVGCHATHDRSWAAVSASPGHKLHLERRIECVACHGGSIHRFQPAAESCRACHAQSVQLPRMQGQHCFACHEFLAPEPARNAARRDCRPCHLAQGVVDSRFPASAPMAFDCARCHKPHQPGGQHRVGCESCHASIAEAGLHGVASHRQCGLCHRPHVWTSAPGDCLRCHAQAAGHAARVTCSECHRWRAPSPPVKSP
jgi:hypothetical protein